MKHVHKLGTEDGVSGSEPAAREDAELKKLSDCPVLCYLWEEREGGRRRREGV